MPPFFCGLFAGCCLNGYFKIYTPNTNKLPRVTSATAVPRHSKGQVSDMGSRSFGRLATELQAKDYCALLPVLTPFSSLHVQHTTSALGLLDQVHWESPESQHRPQHHITATEILPWVRLEHEHWLKTLTRVWEVFSFLPWPLWSNPEQQQSFCIPLA